MRARKPVCPIVQRTPAGNDFRQPVPRVARRRGRGSGGLCAPEPNRLTASGSKEPSRKIEKSIPSSKSRSQRMPPRVNSACAGNPRRRLHALTKRWANRAMNIFCRVLSKFTSIPAASRHAQLRRMEIGMMPFHVRGVRAQSDWNANKMCEASCLRGHSPSGSSASGEFVIRSQPWLSFGNVIISRMLPIQTWLRIRAFFPEYPIT